MPMKWDEKAMYTLLIKLVEQNPQCLSGYDTQKIRNTWPDATVPTAHMIPKQVAELRKLVNAGGKQKGNGSTPSTPRKTPSVLSNGVKIIGTTTPSKRTTPTSSKSSKFDSGSASKRRKISSLTKRKTKKKSGFDTSEDGEEMSQIEISSSSEEHNDDDANGNSTDSDNALTAAAMITKRRVLPARSKSRSKSYVAETDSTGEDADAKETDSEVDGEFRLEGDETQDQREMTVYDEGIDNHEIGLGNVAETTDANMNQNGNSGEVEGIVKREHTDMDMESDVESQSTKRMSWKSAPEEIEDEIE